MFTIKSYYYLNGKPSGVDGADITAPRIRDAVKQARKIAKEYKQTNDNIKLLDYERTYKSERLAYGIYIMNDFRILKEVRVYEI